MADLSDYLDLTASHAREQFRTLLIRRPVTSGRQVVFAPVETLLCLAASFLVNHRQFGGSTADRAPEPVPSLAKLFARPPSSVLAKMANLDGSRSHGGRWDVLAGAILRDDPARFSHVYRLVLRAARLQSKMTPSPATTTGARLCATRWPSRPAPSHPPPDTSTGTGNTSSTRSPGRHSQGLSPTQPRRTIFLPASTRQ